MAIFPVLLHPNHNILCYDQGIGHPIPLAVDGWMTVISHHLFQSQWAAHGDESIWQVFRLVGYCFFSPIGRC